MKDTIDKLAEALRAAAGLIYNCNGEADEVCEQVASALAEYDAQRQARQRPLRRRLAPVPADFPVRALKPGEAAGARCTCGTCGRSWDDSIATSYTPAPSGRCPFEFFH